MKKRVLSILLCIVTLFALVPVTAFAWTRPDNITVNNAKYYSSGALKEIKASFDWHTASATGRLVLMSERLRSAGEEGTSGSYGDFTDLGYYNDSFDSFDEVREFDNTNGTFGIISYTDQGNVVYGTNTMTMTFNNSDISLSNNGIYYVYLWTQYCGKNYPDTLVCAIQVNNGAVKYAVATDRNSYDDSSFDSVTSNVSYNVRITPADNMTRNTASGTEIQNDLTSAMTPVVYTANSGFYFDEDYSVATVNGIMVRRDSNSQITVYGTPSADASITLTAPSALTTYTVKYDANGGMGMMNDVVIEPGRPTLIRENGFLRDGYEFIGWARTANGNVELDCGDFVPSGEVGDVITLFAKWARGIISEDNQIAGLEAAGLNAVAKAEKADVILSVSKETDGESYHNTIKESVGVDKKFDFYDVALTKAMDTDISETSQTIEIKLPYNFDGKEEVTAVRLNGDIVENLTLLDTKATVFTDGTYFADTENNCIYIYTSKFSTLAVTYKNTVTPTRKPSSGSGGGTAKYTVKFDTNGGSTIANKTVVRNNIVAEPAQPQKDGYIFCGWYCDSDFKTSYNFDSKVTKNITLYAKWIKNSAEEEPDTDLPDNGENDTHICPSLNFEDLDVNAWYHYDVDFTLTTGLMRGLDDDTFAPNIPVTRGMMANILYRNENEPQVISSNSFVDVADDAYYANAVLWAKQVGIVTGVTEDEFAPEMHITREDFVTLIYRYTGYRGYDIALGDNEKIETFNDYSQISEYAVEAVRFALAYGLIKGESETTICPKNLTTRAEAAAVFNRLFSGM